MSDFSISAEPRTVTGKHVSKLRREDVIPAVVYGKGIEPTLIQFDGQPLRALFRAGAKTEQIALTVDGKTHNVVVKELQRHVTRGDLVHIDFQIVE